MTDDGGSLGGGSPSCRRLGGLHEGGAPAFGDFYNFLMKITHI